MRSSIGVVVWLGIALLAPLVGAQTSSRVTLTFDGLQTNVRACTNDFGTHTIGEPVYRQFKELGEGVVFLAYQYAIVYGSSTDFVGGDAGESGNPVLAVSTVDDQKCPVERVGHNGILTARFVGPDATEPYFVSNVRVHISDTESSVGVRTISTQGTTIHECSNAFAGCPYEVRRTTWGVNLFFPGEGIAKVKFYDKDAKRRADGFTLDDLSYRP